MSGKHTDWSIMRSIADVKTSSCVLAWSMGVGARLDEQCQIFGAVVGVSGISPGWPLHGRWSRSFDQKNSSASVAGSTTLCPRQQDVASRCPSFSSCYRQESLWWPLASSRCRWRLQSRRGRGRPKPPPASAPHTSSIALAPKTNTSRGDGRTAMQKKFNQKAKRPQQRRRRHALECTTRPSCKSGAQAWTSSPFTGPTLLPSTSLAACSKATRTRTPSKNSSATSASGKSMAQTPGMSTLTLQSCPPVHESSGDLPERGFFPHAEIAPRQFWERANIWVPAGLPNTWRTYLPVNYRTFAYA
eukprot:6486700-Amphidinium_carterae.1